MIKKLTDLCDLNLETHKILLLCDIDDVILYFPQIYRNWWKDTFNDLYTIHKDYNKVETIQHDMWLDIIHNNDCCYTVDPSHFQNKINCSNCEIEFVTARDISLKNITEKQLCIWSNKIVHYVGSNCKGEYIKKNILPYRINYDKIIFIDDMLKNVEAVDSICSQINEKNTVLECYHFINDKLI